MITGVNRVFNKYILVDVVDRIVVDELIVDTDVVDHPADFAKSYFQDQRDQDMRLRVFLEVGGQ